MIEGHVFENMPDNTAWNRDKYCETFLFHCVLFSNNEYNVYGQFHTHTHTHLAHLALL